MVSPGDRSLELKIESSSALYKLYQLFDELGFARRYSEDMGELEIAIHGEWILFFVDRRSLDEEREMDRAFEDAQRVAEYYWRQ